MPPSAWQWLSASTPTPEEQTFAVQDSDGTWYLDLTADMPLGDWIGVKGLNLVAHWAGRSTPAPIGATGRSAALAATTSLLVQRLEDRR